MEVSTVIETINKTKARRNTDLPLIIHSDRGSQYVSNAWREATEKMQRSYSHSGYPYDNACIESFHSLIKREWLNRFNIINYKHAYRLVFEYIERQYFPFILSVTTYFIKFFIAFRSLYFLLTIFTLSFLSFSINHLPLPVGYRYL